MPHTPLRSARPSPILIAAQGATGIDGIVEAPVARRGILVGLVKNPGNASTANNEMALAA